MTTVPSFVTSKRPRTSAAYLAASALYRAGFRGWPLVVMTAIAGQQSNWNPTALNNNPSTGDYSVGAWQINYYGNLKTSREQSYGTPSYLMANPQKQADAAYQLAGGNSLQGLSNWALSASPKQGETPTPIMGGASIANYIPSGIAAASEVGTFGPAPASQIAQASTWPGASALGSALAPGSPGPLGSQTRAQAMAAGSASAAKGCAAKGKVFGFGGVLGVGGFSFTHCQLKALIGGLAVAGGALVMVIGAVSMARGLSPVTVAGAIVPRPSRSAAAPATEGGA
jgi:hypothetical protein